MKSDLLNVDQVVSLWHIRRDCRRQLSRVKVGKREWIERSSPLGNFKPMSSRPIPGRSGRARRDLSEIDSCRPQVVESIVKFKANSGSSSHRYSGGSRSIDVARQVRRGSGGDRRVACGLADSCSARRRARDQRVPDIMCRCLLSEPSNDGGAERKAKSQDAPTSLPPQQLPQQRRRG